MLRCVLCVCIWGAPSWTVVLGFPCAHAAVSAVAARACSIISIAHCLTCEPWYQVNFSGNFVRAEVANSIIHGVGLALSVMGAFPQGSRARASRDPAHLLGVIAYCVGLIGMYLSTTLGHSLFWLEGTSRFFRLIDKVTM